MLDFHTVAGGKDTPVAGGHLFVHHNPARCADLQATLSGKRGIGFHAHGDDDVIHREIALGRLHDGTLFGFDHALEGAIGIDLHAFTLEVGFNRLCHLLIEHGGQDVRSSLEKNHPGAPHGRARFHEFAPGGPGAHHADG